MHSPFIFLMSALDLQCTAKILSPSVAATTKHTHTTLSCISLHTQLRHSAPRSRSLISSGSQNTSSSVDREENKYSLSLERSTPTQPCCDARQRRVTAGVPAADTLALYAVPAPRTDAYPALPTDGATNKHQPFMFTLATIIAIIN